MEYPQNGSNMQWNVDISNLAKEIFYKLIALHDLERAKGVFVWQRSPTANGSYDVSEKSINSEGASTPHLISSVVLRCTRKNGEDRWEFEHHWDNVDISRLGDIGPATYEWYHMNDNGERHVMSAMRENVNIVLMRNIIDWSRADGNVWSQHIVWSGSFSDSQRMMQQLEKNSSSLLLIGQYFEHHPQLKRQFISLHVYHPIAAAISAVLSAPVVTFSKELACTSAGGDDNDDDELVCSICFQTYSSGDYARKLPCNHDYHEHCLLGWFYHHLTCPQCRREIK